MITTNLYGIKTLSQLKEKSYEIHSLNPTVALSDFLFKVENSYQLREEILPEIERQIESFGFLNKSNINVDKIKVNKIYYSNIGNIEFIYN